MTVRVNKSAFNIREKLSELERPIGLKGSELAAAETAQEARDLVSAGRRNLIINGDFRVSQRGDYSSTTTVANNGYYLDRWKIFLKPGVTTGNIQRLTTNQPPNAPADSYSVRVTATNTASGDLRLSQPFENPTRFRSQTVTLSAWVKTNSSNCRLYYFVGGSYTSGNWAIMSLFIGGSATRAFGSIPTPVTMRRTPDVTFSNVNLHSTYTENVTNLVAYSQTGRNGEYNGLSFEANTASGLVSGQVYRMHIKNVSGTSGYIKLNSEL